MTTTTKPMEDGGPAFPCDPFIASKPGHESVAKRLAEGMSLRDYFAGKVMQGLCANPGGPFQACNQSGWTLVNCTFDQIAEESYELADAMLRAR